MYNRTMMKLTEQYLIIWPEQRLVSPEQIRTWYDDAVANGELEPEWLGLEEPFNMARALHHTGLITLHKDSPL